MKLYEQDSERGFNCTISNVRDVYEIGQGRWACVVDLQMDGEAVEAVEYIADVNDVVSVGQWVVARIVNGKAGRVGTSEEYEIAKQSKKDAEWNALPTDERKVRLKSLAASLRWEKETGGLVVNGMSIATDDRSKTLLNGKVRMAEKDPNAVHRWKSESGEIRLTSAEIIAIGDAVAAFVQDCFDTELDVCALIDDGVIADEDKVRSYFL